MTTDAHATGTTDCPTSLGCPQLLRVYRIALHPERLALVLAGAFLTLCWGSLLDLIWTATDHDVPSDALSAYAEGVEPTSQSTTGPFATLRAFETACLRDAIESVRYARFIGPLHIGEPTPPPPADTGHHPARGLLANLLLMGRGGTWLIAHHPLFALLLIPPLIIIWSLVGGAVSRTTAVKLATDESLSIKNAIAFVKPKLFSGFVLAPAIPLAACMLIGLTLWIGGLFLAIPWLGDLLGGLAFGLALIAGLVMAIILVGTVAGGSLFGPTVAVEATDGFDAVQRGFSYVYGRPLRAIWYAVCLIVLASFGWLTVMFFIWLAAACAHLFVGLGSGLFGDWGDAPNKLTLLWSPPTFESLRAPTNQLTGVQSAASSLIAIWVTLWWGLAWSFLGSFYFCGSTVAYLLLRRDVDGVDITDICIDDPDTATETTPAPNGAEA